MAKNQVPQQRLSGNLTEPQPNDEPLKVIPIADLEGLLQVLRKDTPRDICAEGLVKNAIQWNKNKNTLLNHHIYAPFGDTKNGACISIFNMPEISLQSVSFYSRNPQESRMLDALDKTKLINWGASGIFAFYSVSEELLPIINELVSRKNLEKVFLDRSDLLWMDKEQVRNVKVECPTDVEIQKLSLKHIDYLDSYWSHRFEGSKTYLRALLECNLGLGLFLPSTELPVAWALISESLAIRSLFVLPTHRRRGYAQLLCNAMARKLGEMDVDPHANVLVDNSASKKMFESLGFEVVSHSSFIRLRPK